MSDSVPPETPPAISEISEDFDAFASPIASDLKARRYGAAKMLHIHIMDMVPEIEFLLYLPRHHGYQKSGSTRDANHNDVAIQ